MTKANWHYWQDLSSSEIDNNLTQGALVIWPWGATEQHGPHLPTSTDTKIVEAIVKRASSAAQTPVSALILPTLSIGLSIEHGCSAGSLTLKSSLMINMLEHMVDQISVQGAKRLLIVNGHGGQNSIAEIVAFYARNQRNIQTAWVHVDALGQPQGTVDAEELRFGIHGGLIETALMLAIAPELVQMNKAQDFQSHRKANLENNKVLGAKSGARLAWSSKDLSQHGVVGDAMNATPELGDKICNHRAQSLVTLANELLNFNFVS